MSEAIRSELGVGVPQIIAGEIDVLPPDGGKVSKQRVRDDFPAAAEVAHDVLLLIDCLVEHAGCAICGKAT